MKFTKMHGLGNDYIYINCFDEMVENPNELTIKMSDRHFGVGSDGLVLILPSKVADFKMRMFNADGSEAQMCGNAIRCIGKYVYENRLTDKKSIVVETLAGNKLLEMTPINGKIDFVRVDMGEPILEAKKIPIISKKPIVIREKFKVQGKSYLFTCVSMGNPHAVTFVDNVDGINVNEIGRLIENHKAFPERTNVEFVEIINNGVLKMRVWERGSGETLACGTGACASLVAAVLNDLANRRAKVKLIGGDLDIEWRVKNNHIYMSGPATVVFESEWIK